MRNSADAEKIHRFLSRLGTESRGPGNVYLTGGATALLLGWRETTLDVDLSMDPEPVGAFEAISTLKDDLQINVELAAPSHFVPELPGWRERSLFIDAAGPVRFFHYDMYSQVLSKVARGHTRDLDDARQMVKRGFVDPAELLRLFECVEGNLIRYPAIDADELRHRLDLFVATSGDDA